MARKAVFNPVGPAIPERNFGHFVGEGKVKNKMNGRAKP